MEINDFDKVHLQHDLVYEKKKILSEGQQVAKSYVINLSQLL